MNVLSNSTNDKKQVYKKPKMKNVTWIFFQKMKYLWQEFAEMTQLVVILK